MPSLLELYQMMPNQLMLLLAALASLFFPLPLRYHPATGAGHILQLLGNKVANPSNSFSQQQLAGLLALMLVILPSLALVVALKEVLIFAEFFDFLLLLFLFEWRAYVTAFDHSRQSLLVTDKSQARNNLDLITLRDVDALSQLGLQKAAAESLPLHLAHRWFVVFFWFAVAGIYGALACRLLQLCNFYWNRKKTRFRHFGIAAQQAYQTVSFIPCLLLAFTLSCYGNTRYALKNLFHQGASWPMLSSGLVISALASSLKIQLGGARMYETIKVRFALMGTGDIISQGHLTPLKQRLNHAAWLWIIVYVVLNICWWLIQQPRY
ncbi:MULTISPECIES: cobalamin biosynthesis protein [Motilimonas]|uniref:Cobalamin biosynthesis protein n=1 Tax=Motilimonas cestriensis TaxID=2742685 RepID=A0ABS8W5W3_9GAMM|nr:MULTISPECIES: cobalamin biosynthesis protein [Motilimonas]MCE0557471.1 cobalamin biosynthesis protein [Motilimonas sp. E26]MCE2594367.1 cobalamin biosynthesis protein [Motilimonas cestriensis]MDO6525758.1 cobalamin biosynthesis protein [Motilimonas sp. 1_MG-2023]